MDITIENKTPEKLRNADERSHFMLPGCQIYKVCVDNHRILTVFTESQKVAEKWFAEVLKSHRRTNSGELIVVGISYDSEEDILTICLGSQCLHYSPCYNRINCRNFRAFFSDHRITVVGVNMSAIEKDLENRHHIKLCKPVDVNKVAECVYKKTHLDIRRYDLDQLAKTVLGKHFDVIRPDPDEYLPIFGDEYTKFATVDVYLLYLLGIELLSHRGYVFANPSSYSNYNKKVIDEKSKKKKKNYCSC